MTILNSSNYFDLANGVLTRSKLKDFSVDKNYFYRKHILGEIKDDKKKAFLIGSVVDELLTFLDGKDKYIVITTDGRTKAGKEDRASAAADGLTVISGEEYETIMDIACAVEQCDAYKEIIEHGYVKQGILQTPMDLGPHFSSIASMIDFHKIDGNKCTFVDLKTAQDIDPERYHYKALAFWYYAQMAMNTWLVNILYPDVTEFEYYNLVVDKTKNINHVRLFRLANSRVESELDAIQERVKELKEEREFAKYNPSLANAITIGMMWDEE